MQHAACSAREPLATLNFTAIFRPQDILPARPSASVNDNIKAKAGMFKVQLRSLLRYKQASTGRKLCSRIVPHFTSL